MLPYLTDTEIDDICAGLTQSAAKVRFLQRLGLHVERKPNGRPLVRRVDWERQTGDTASAATRGPRWTVAA